MIAVGITGGIGSGKTAFTNVWESLGARVVYADDLAKEMMQAEPALIKSLKKTFGEETYNDDGTLNKPHLIEQAFNKDRVDELNAIVHPAIQRKTKALIEKAKEDTAEVFAYEAAILLNYGRPEYLDYIVLVTSDREIRINRVADRDSINKDDVIARLEKQPDFNSLHHLADFIITNNGTLQELEGKAKSLYRKLVGNH